MEGLSTPQRINQRAADQMLRVLAGEPIPVPGPLSADQQAFMRGAYHAQGIGHAVVAEETRDNADLANWRYADGTPNGGFHEGADITKELVAKIEELRAVLGPLLANPDAPRSGDGERDFGCCVFCECEVPHRIPGDHEPHCPVLRADALMGRS